LEDSQSNFQSCTTLFLFKGSVKFYTMITNGHLHHAILRHIIDKGFAPDAETLAAQLQSTREEVVQALYTLQDYHGLVLHPKEPKVWVIHPFSLAPTNFLVRSAKGLWWGNCAWCSLGVAALLNQDVSITTRIAAYDKQVVISIKNGKLQNTEFYIHFPIPMQKAWDNVIYTCSNMLVFENEDQIDEWTRRHDISKGDVQPIENVWAFSKEWYGNHLNPEWTKWTMEEAKEIFSKYKLTGDTWQLETSAKRF